MSDRAREPEVREKGSGSAVVLRALQLIETVAGSDRPLALPEICALLHLPKPPRTVYASSLSRPVM